MSTGLPVWFRHVDGFTLNQRFFFVITKKKSLWICKKKSKKNLRFISEEKGERERWRGRSEPRRKGLNDHPDPHPPPLEIPVLMLHLGFAPLFFDLFQTLMERKPVCVYISLLCFVFSEHFFNLWNVNFVHLHVESLSLWPFCNVNWWSPLWQCLILVSLV